MRPKKNPCLLVDRSNRLGQKIIQIHLAIAVLQLGGRRPVPVDFRELDELVCVRGELADRRMSVESQSSIGLNLVERETVGIAEDGVMIRRIRQENEFHDQRWICRHLPCVCRLWKITATTFHLSRSAALRCRPPVVPTTRALELEQRKCVGQP